MIQTTPLRPAASRNHADFLALLAMRMQEKGELPVLAKSIRHFKAQIDNRDNVGIDIINAILGDFTLTQRVIRLANSSLHSISGNGVTTVTQAVAIAGLDSIARMVANLSLLDEQSATTPESYEVHLELEKALLASDIARNVAAISCKDHVEEAVIRVMMLHVARLMVAFYCPEIWCKIRRVAAGDYEREQSAAQWITGVSLGEVTSVVAGNWRLPRTMIEHDLMLSINDAADHPGSDAWLQALSHFAARTASLLINKNADQRSLKNFVARCGLPLQITITDLLQAITSARKQPLIKHLSFEVEKLSIVSSDFRHRLTLGIMELGLAGSRGLDFGSALAIVLETIYAGMRFNRVVTFLRSAGRFRAEFHLGKLHAAVLPKLVFPEAYAADIFHLSLLHQADVFVQDTLQSRECTLPEWFKQSLPDAGAFILLPLVAHGRNVGLIYADWSLGATSKIKPDDFLSLGSLRDQLMQSWHNV